MNLSPLFESPLETARQDPGTHGPHSQTSSIKEQHLEEVEAFVRSYYASVASEYSEIVRRHRYCYDRQLRLLKHLVPKPGKVLEIGCGIGQFLSGLGVESGVGIDFCPEMVAEARRQHPTAQFPNLKFECVSARHCSQLEQKFDTIFLINSLTELSDVVQVFKEIHSLCTPETRVVTLTFNYRWEWILKSGAKVGLCQDHPAQNWLSMADYNNMLYLSEFELVKSCFELLMPLGIPLVSDLINRYGSILPFVRDFSMIHCGIIRPLTPPADTDDVSVSVVIPCKNEEGNIASLVARTPEMGKQTELVFVDDRSTDSTAARVRDQIRLHPARKIKLVEGPGEGKGAACRAGFAQAENDVLMILDADMTTMPETLPEFLDALVLRKGEFINGSRLVYPMKGKAMRFLNVLGNKVFATLISFLLSQSVKDTLCGTKVMWRRDYGSILESRQRFGNMDVWGDYDWLFGASLHNLKIVELPVHYVERVAGETKMTRRFRQGALMLRMCWMGFWRMKVL